jgi:uncharacterized protein (TIGR03118 family)
MKNIRSSVITIGLIVLSLSLSPTFGKGKPMGKGPMGKGKGLGFNNFSSANLVSDLDTVGAKFVDAHLVNPWGMALSSSNTIFISDNGMGVSTEYNLDGTATGLVITIPPSSFNTDGANPTGIVANGTPFFNVMKNGNSLPSTFIFVAEDGSISGWNPMVDPTNAIIAVDHGNVPTVPSGAVYKGATMGVANGHNFLFVTNFRAGTVETYDESFMQVNIGKFLDPSLPPTPFGMPGFAPFGIANINGQIYVTYALQKPDQHDDMAGAGNGFVNVFDTSGNFVRRLISQGELNSPWGLTLHSGGFGRFNGELFVGNFGDGKINVYDPMNGTFLGTIMNHDGSGPLVFDGLWSLLSINVNLFFTAGIAGEAHGLFGVINHGNSAHRHR